MNIKKKRFALKKRLIKHFLSLTLAGSLLMPGLVLIRAERVEANIIADMAGGVVGKLRYNATVAEIIISLLSGSGAGVTNTNYLNKLNASYGIESSLATATNTDGTIGAMYEAGLFSIADDGTFIDNGLLSAIESQPAYTECNVDSIIGTWNQADDAIVTSASQNIGSGIGAAAALGVVSQVGGAFMLGVSLGNVANNFINQYKRQMGLRQYIDISDAQMANVETRAGYSPAYAIGLNSSNQVRNRAFQYSNDLIAICAICPHRTNNTVQNLNWIFYNPNTYTTEMYYTATTSSNVFGNAFNGTSATVQPEGTTGSLGGFTSLKDYKISGFNIMTFASQDAVDAYKQSLADGTTVLSPQNYPNPNYSPDVIGPEGNQRPTIINNNITFPSLQPSVPEGQGVSVIPWDEYIDFVNDANTNTINNNTTIQQGDTYNNFIENYYVTPDTIETPSPEVQQPDYTPTVPEQPTPNTKPTNTPETNQSNTDYMSTPGLKDVFPFCIPWDIAGLFGVFSTNNREAPVVTFPIVSELFGIDEEVTIDLSPYNEVASLLRLLELIAFGLGLAFVTRYLIGAGG